MRNALTYQRFSTGPRCPRPRESAAVLVRHVPLVVQDEAGPNDAREGLSKWRLPQRDKASSRRRFG